MNLKVLTALTGELQRKGLSREHIKSKSLKPVIHAFHFTIHIHSSHLWSPRTERDKTNFDFSFTQGRGMNPDHQAEF